MKKFRRKGGAVVTRLSPYEVELLASLVAQLVEMITDGEPETYAQPASDDPFELWAQDLASDPDQPETHEDPVLRRLFPDAYPHDAVASSDFRRFTERELKTKKVTDARIVLDRLGATELGTVELRIPQAEMQAWLRTLTSVRIAVATRLGISDAESAEALAELADDDPRAFMASVYDWLGFAQETLISAL
ncbi:MAG: DUF2017 domain-containing protein [Microlunatus sp.]|nr:DUF2017 domain-containing protein [Microlunatus sp.]MDN5769781.1 DUF2017 domain-containing protein [Microlunatus sp.]MDN5803457.1 DUF2017 domain-containing protein [Microlunatus sp.]